MSLTIVPLGAVSFRSVIAVQMALERTFRMDVRVVAERPLPKSAYQAPRGRYRNDSVVGSLASVPIGDKVLGLPSVDISTEAHGIRDWSILGRAQMNVRVSVVSSFRTHRNLERLGDIAIHEVGHTLGLPHCPTPGCTMQDAKGKLARIGKGFCPACRRKIARWLR